MIWTAEQDETLRGLILSGEPYSRIGPVFGVSRNAAIGRAHRLGIGNTRPVKPLVPRAPKRLKQTPKILIAGRNVRHVFEAIDIEELRSADILPRNVALLDLMPNDCRYPYGDKAITFCGHPKMDGRPYCAGHFALCWRPSPRQASQKPLYRERRVAA